MRTSWHLFLEPRLLDSCARAAFRGVRALTAVHNRRRANAQAKLVLDEIGTTQLVLNEMNLNERDVAQD